MNADEQMDDAVRVAHGALTGLLTVPNFDLDGYLKSEVFDVPADDRGPLLARLFAAAVAEHAGTLRGLSQVGADVPAILRGFTANRPQADS